MKNVAIVLLCLMTMAATGCCTSEPGRQVEHEEAHRNNLIRVERDYPPRLISGIKERLVDRLTAQGRLTCDESTGTVILVDEAKVVEEALAEVDAWVTSQPHIEPVSEESFAVLEIPTNGESSTLREIEALLSDEGRAVHNPDRESVVVYDRESVAVEIRRRHPDAK